MRKAIAVVLAITAMLAASIAAATPAHADATGFALAVNPPVGWATGSVGRFDLAPEAFLRIGFAMLP